MPVIESHIVDARFYNNRIREVCVSSLFKAKNLKVRLAKVIDTAGDTASSK